MFHDQLAPFINDIERYLSLSNGIAIAILDTELNVVDCNLGFMRLFSPPHKPVSVPLADFLMIDAVSVRYGEELKLQFSRKTGSDGVVNCWLFRNEQGTILVCERALLTESRALEQIGVVNDELINLQRELVKKNRIQEKLQLELGIRVHELEEALLRIKKLEGIIPICMYCKSIRDDKELWHQVDKYISENSEAEFTHGICPVCFEKHYGN